MIDSKSPLGVGDDRGRNDVRARLVEGLTRGSKGCPRRDNVVEEEHRAAPESMLVPRGDTDGRDSVVLPFSLREADLIEPAAVNLQPPVRCRCWAQRCREKLNVTVAALSEARGR